MTSPHTLVVSEEVTPKEISLSANLINLLAVNAAAKEIGLAQGSDRGEGV
jgi:hypothetical protein